MKPFFILFPMAFVYILFSESLDKFYVGSTSTDLADRLRRHLSSHSGFTAKVKDWRIVYSEPFPDKAQALKREKEIKAWKSRAMIAKLIRETGL